MPGAVGELESRLKQAICTAFGQQYVGQNALVQSCQDKRFGDYQCNVAMSLSKQLGHKPREVASRIIENLQVEDICEQPTIAGPGFINFQLKNSWVAEQLNSLLDDPHLGVDQVGAEQVQTVVVDYSGPNIAKQMHVGHLRSTIIGDVIGRVLEFLGHKVIRQNHIGDWGTQFGMLIAQLEDNFSFEDIVEGKFHIADLEQFYRQAQERFEADQDFATRARQQVVLLQQGDPRALQFWRGLRAESLRHCRRIYDKLGISFEDQEIRGESHYNSLLAPVVEQLLKQGLAREDDGAICVFLDGFVRKDGQPLPVMIRKSDGGFLYATTDLAALRYRVGELAAHRIIYVTDARQNLHFQQIFALVAKAGWNVHPQTHEPVKLEHVTFGSILGNNGRPLKTRTGENVKLGELLDQAVARARKIVDQKNPDLSQDARGGIAETIGIAAVKYADLAQNRTSDYVFSFDKMLAMEGNTAPYLLYAYARIRSIGRKGQVDFGQLSSGGDVLLAHQAEIDLGKKLLEFSEVINQLANSLKPNILINYLYELSQWFSVFYENCPVLKADSVEDRNSRLQLCQLTARTLKCGLNLLGIEPLEQM